MKFEIVLCMIIEVSLAAVSSKPSTATVGKEPQCDGVVAFSSVGKGAILSSSIVSYKKTITQSGTGWNQELGVYTSPCNGVYNVAFSGDVNPSSKLTLSKRDVTSRSWAPIVSVTKQVPANSVLVSLSKGDQIAVLLNGSFEPETQITVTTFNGFLIH